MTSPNRSLHDVAIVGMACRFPSAPDLDGYWKLLREGKTAFREIPTDRWDHRLYYDAEGGEPDTTYARHGAFLDDVRSFAALHYGLPPLRVKVTDPQQRLMLDVMRAAIEDAGYERRIGYRAPIGVFVGASVSDYKNYSTLRGRAREIFSGAFGPLPDSLRDEPNPLAAVESILPPRAFSMVGALVNMIAAAVSQHFDFSGPSLTLDSACSSALVGIHEGVLHLRAGLCEAALVGGVYLNLSPDSILAFSRIGAISREGVCRPFDARRDGFVIGEGVGAVYLKLLDDAERDGDRIYAVIRGVGCNNDGRGEGPMTPRLDGQVGALSLAYTDAGVSPDEIGFVEAHGTATPVGDLVEVQALHEYYSAHSKKPRRRHLSSAKANIGHALSAAGIASLIKTALVLHHRTIVPHPTFEEPNPELELSERGFEIAREAVAFASDEGAVRRAALSSFGFGGTNVHLVLEESPPRAHPPAADAPQPILVSAPNADLLRSHLAALEEAVRGSDAPLGDIAYTLTALRKTHRARVAFVASTREELCEKLAQATSARSSAPGLHFVEGERDTPPRIAFLFPGQGSQSVGMLSHLYQRFPRFRMRLKALAGLLEDAFERPLLAYVYPPEGADAGAAQAALTRTEVCQPAVAALSLSLAELLGYWGVEPDVVAGHSLGELVAAAIVGLMSAEEALQLVAVRGEAMANLPLDDAGSMAAVATDAEGLAERLAEGVVIANRNCPGQVVISGPTDGVARTVSELRQCGIHCTELAVSHAFHSPLVAGAEDAVASFLATVPVHASRIPLISAATGRPYPEDAGGIREMLIHHANAPVDFVAALRGCQEQGASIFVEVGPGATLSGFVRRTIGRDATALPAALARDEGAERLCDALCQLAVLGVQVRFDRFFEGFSVRPVTLPSCPLEVQQYWMVGEPSAKAQQPAGSASRPAPARTTGKPELERLFREQLTVFQQQNELIRKQVEALAAAGVEVPDLLWAPAGGAPAIAPTPDPRPERVQPGGGEAPVGAGGPADAEQRRAEGALADRVLDAVARVSGFPRDDLRLDQRFFAELGFDSIMAVELDLALQESIPDLEGLPRSLFSESTQVADVVEYLDSVFGSHAPGRSMDGGDSTSDATVGRSEEEDATTTVESAIIAAIARVSGFPAGDLRLDQRFFADLGFDSIMAVELELALDEELPGTGSLPRSLFSEQTRVQDLVEYLQRGSEPDQESPGDSTRGISNLQRYRPSLVAIPARVGGPPPALTDLVVVSDRRGIAPSLVSLLEGTGVRVRVIASNDPMPEGARGCIDLSGLEETADIDTGNASDWRAPARELWRRARAMADAKPPECFVAVTGLGGGLGLEPAGGAVVQGGIGGLGKALAREWPGALVKSIDLDPAAPAAILAEQIFGELCSGDTTAEVGYLADGTRRVVRLIEATGGETRELSERPVVVVTGGAKGIGATIALDLARRYRARLALFGRTPSDSADAGKLTEHLESLRNAGAQVLYQAWDVREPSTAAALFDRIREELGPVQGVIHAAGVLADGPVGQKKEEEFDLVFDTKIAGMLHLYRLTRDDPLEFFIGFGSWAGRFGNAHQTDYAAANDLMAKLAVEIDRARPATRVAVIDWPLWESGGMSAALTESQRSALRGRGVTILTDAVGCEALARELVESGPPEVLFGEGLPERLGGHRTSLLISAETHPYLNDHRIKSEPVLPMAAAMDLVARAVPVEVGPEHPTLSDFQLFRGVPVQGEVCVQIETRYEVREGSPRNVEVEIRSGVSGGGRGALAYRCKVHGGAMVEPDGEPVSGRAPPGDRLPLSLAEFYRRHTFHGPRLQGVLEVEGMDERGITGTVRTSRPADWLAAPAFERWAIDPLVIDSSLQLAAYWAKVQHDAAGLPVGFERFRWRAPFGEGPVHCAVIFDSVDGGLAKCRITYRAPDSSVLAVLEGMQARFARVEPQGEGHLVP